MCVSVCMCVCLDFLTHFNTLVPAYMHAVYRRQKCQGEVYAVCFDRLNAWCLFDDSAAVPIVWVQRLFLAEAGVRLPGRSDAKALHESEALRNDTAT